MLGHPARQGSDDGGAVTIFADLMRANPARRVTRERSGRSASIHTPTDCGNRRIRNPIQYCVSVVKNEGERRMRSCLRSMGSVTSGARFGAVKAAKERYGGRRRNQPC